MKLINNKALYFVILLISFIGINALLILGIGTILDYLNTGAERKKILHLEPEAINTYFPQVKWISLQNPGRKMENNTLKNIETDYLFSWFIKNKALENNDSTGINDFYTDNSRKILKQNIIFNKKNNIHIESTTLKHHPKIEFYSADGQLVVFTDKNVIQYQRSYNKKIRTATLQDTATYKVMMLLEDGFWRIRHMKRLPKTNETFEHLHPRKKNQIYSIEGKKIKKDSVDFTIKGINYYPKNSAWDTFGANFNLDTIAKDFDIIARAKLNTIRIFIQYEDFGKANIPLQKIKKLKLLLDLAQTKKLSVIVTLFDFYGDYSVDTWTLTFKHAKTIVSNFKNHKAILAWDIKNEPDLDFKSRGKENVLDWLSQMLTIIKENDPNHLTTIGWSNSIAANQLKEKVSFVSYHFYNPLENFTQEHLDLEKATKKPVVIQEFGIPSYKGIWNWFGNNEEDQAIFHKNIQEKFKTGKLSFVSWTLYDFPKVPNKVAGKWPWVKQKQKKFGFINLKNKPKPSFKYITY